MQAPGGRVEVCPSQRKAAALIMPICNTAAMNLKSSGLYELYWQHVEQLRAKKGRKLTQQTKARNPVPSLRNRKFESVSLQR
jgi:uncharacterized membrane protein